MNSSFLTSLQRLRTFALVALTLATAVVAACTSSSSSSCVDIVASPADLACTADSDCVSVFTGTLCGGYSPYSVCDVSAANAAGAQRLRAQASAVPPGANVPGDVCDVAEMPLRCIHEQCVACGFTDDGLCASTPEDGGAPDGGSALDAGDAGG